MKIQILKKVPAGVAILGLIALSSTTSVLAKDVKMSVFEGYKSSEAVLAGDYSKAIELAVPAFESTSSYKRTVEATTLCVAYTKTKMFESAKSYCEQALANSTKAATLRKAAPAYSDDISSPVSIVKVTETNHKAMLSMIERYDVSASD